MNRPALALGLECELDILVPDAIETWGLLSRLSKHLLVKSSVRPGRSLARPLTRD